MVLNKLSAVQCSGDIEGPTLQETAAYYRTSNPGVNVGAIKENTPIRTVRLVNTLKEITKKKISLMFETQMSRCHL